jgi:hypothetical protein
VDSILTDVNKNSYKSDYLTLMTNPFPIPKACIIMMTGFFSLLLSCQREGVPQGMEQPARLIRIDTVWAKGDPVWKTLTFEWIQRPNDYYQIQFVPLFDIRKIGVVYPIQRPLSAVTKTILE